MMFSEFIFIRRLFDLYLVAGKFIALTRSIILILNLTLNIIKFPFSALFVQLKKKKKGGGGVVFQIDALIEAIVYSISSQEDILLRMTGFVYFGFIMLLIPCGLYNNFSISFNWKAPVYPLSIVKMDTKCNIQLLINIVTLTSKSNQYIFCFIFENY